MRKIYVLAGEASGDLHGANLIANLLVESREPLDFYGAGGDRIKAMGVKNFFDLAHFHVTGLTDALKRLPDYKKAAKTIYADIERARPDLVVLIDNPGFNLHMAEKIHALGIPIVYYIAPQIWAWAPKRIEKIKKYVKKVLVVFDFEKKIYEDHGVPVECVGHPLCDLMGSVSPTAEWRKKDSRLIALLPGSRKGELKMLFEVLVKAAAEIRTKIPSARFALIQAPTLPRHFYDRLLKGSESLIELVDRNSYGVIKAADLAVVCSGTATLECALLGTPMIIVNKGTLLTYAFAKTVIRVPYLGLPNLVLGRGAIPELLQFNATPKKIARQAVHLLKDAEARQVMLRSLIEVKEKLGGPGANKRAAREVLKTLTT